MNFDKEMAELFEKVCSGEIKPDLVAKMQKAKDMLKVVKNEIWAAGGGIEDNRLRKMTVEELLIICALNSIDISAKYNKPVGEEELADLPSLEDIVLFGTKRIASCSPRRVVSSYGF